MSDPLEIAFTYTRDEYVLAMRRHYKTVLKFWRDLITGIIAVVLGGYLVATGSGWVAWLLLIIGALLLLMLIYGIFLLPAIIYNSQPKLKNEYRLTFCNDGIGFKTDGIDSTLQWSLYHSWLSDDDFYIMYHGNRDVTVMPRRVLIGDRDGQFREMLKKHLGPAVT